MSNRETRKSSTRRSKEIRGEGRQVSEKHLEERKEKINNSPLKPMNELQAEYIKLIRDKTLILATGYPGTSKTYIPTVIACDQYALTEIDKIYLIRPPVSKSKSLGFWSGSMEEKAANWLGESLSVIKERLGQGTFELALKRGDLEFIPLEVLKGRSLKNCFVLVDEAEDITIEEARKLVTRIGENCTMVLSGDIGQVDLPTKSGLRFLREVAEKNPELEESTGVVDFNRPNDIVRSDVCRKWTMALVREGIGGLDE